MAHFTFKARNSKGEIRKGEQDAKDRFEIYKMIKESGETVVSVEEKSKLSLPKGFNISFGGVKAQDRINFARSLGSMIKAGLSMSQALSVMEGQGKNKVVKKIIASINESIRQGKTLSDSMKEHPKMFSPLMIAMVHSGEQSGTLGESLRLVTIDMDKSFALRRRVRGAMMYPGVIFSAMLIIAILLLTYVVPTLTKTFTELNLNLPSSTKFVLWLSNLFQTQGLLVLGLMALLALVVYWLSKKPAGKNIIHKVILKIPVIGNLIKEVNVARTARTLSSLVSSDVDLLDSIRITGDILQNVHYKKVLEKAGTTVERGEPLSKVFGEHTDLYPIFLSEMVKVGEETGKIGEMLVGVAVYFEDDVDQKTKDMSTIIEPVLMVTIGAAVGFFAVAMITPMYSLVNTL